MATVLYETMMGELAPHVSGVPNPVMVAYIRKVVIDLCERAKVWRVKLADVPLVAGTYEYALVSPVAQSEVSTILEARNTLTNANFTKQLMVMTYDQARHEFPTWPESGASEPRAVLRIDAASFQVAPVPGTADTYTLKMLAAIRPTIDSTGWEGALFTEFRRAIFHGVLHELMMMPDRPWSNDKLALYHGKQWEYMLWNAKARANKGFGSASINVAMRPWA